MHSPRLFDSFFLGGFECASHRRHDGRRLDLIDACQHDRHVDADYGALRRHGIRTVRDGLRWHRIEVSPNRYDFSSFLPMLRAAAGGSGGRRAQVIWDLCHYGYPDHLDIWRPSFVDALARFARATATVVRQESDDVPFYCVVNEASYWSWAGGEHGLINPYGAGRGLELKHQLTRATIAGIEAIREVDPRARFVHTDPLIHAHPASPEDAESAASYDRSQLDAWLLLSGELWPGLGGKPSYLDIVGVNFYSNNQWEHGGDAHGRTIPPGDPRFLPLRELLARVATALPRRPILIAETGAEGELRAPWLRYVGEEVRAALRAGIPVEGVCLYPVVDYPGWTNERYCPTGLLGFAGLDGRRPVFPELADELAAQQRLVGGTIAMCRPESSIGIWPNIDAEDHATSR